MASAKCTNDYEFFLFRVGVYSGDRLDLAIVQYRVVIYFFM